MSQTPEQHRTKTISGLKWSGINQVIKQGLNITVGILLARLLTPTDFGLIGMITIITGFIQLFNDFGFGSALIQKKDADELDYNSVFWFNLVTGIFFCLVLQLSGGLIAQFYDKPQLVFLIRIVSFMFIIQALGYVQYTLFRKHLNFKSIFWVESLTMVISGTTALIMAAKGYGVWSLVVQLMVNSLINVITLWVFSTWRPNFTYSWNRIKQLINYSMPLLGSSVLGYLLGNLDKLLIGRFLGPISLGIYTRAYSLMVFPVGQISGVISQVMFPSLAHIQHDKERIKQIYLKMNRIISAVTFPIMAIAFIVAEPFILVVLGEQWREMIPIFKLLTVVGAFQSVGTLVGNIFMALGETKKYFKVSFYSGLVLILGSIIGLQFGIIGVTLGLLLATLTIALPQWFITGKFINLSLVKYLQVLSRNALLTIIVVISYVFITQFNLISSLTTQLFVFGFGSVLLYGILTLVFNKLLLIEIKNYFKP